jgi:hypothetical protein
MQHSNSISDAAAIAILDGLKVNSSVTWLELVSGKDNCCLYFGFGGLL